MRIGFVDYETEGYLGESRLKILLITPKFTDRPGRYYEFPLGIAYISSTLKQAGHDVQCLNLSNLEKSPEEATARAVTEIAPDLCRTGGLSPHFSQIQAILAAARRAKPSLVTIVGGGLLSSDPETALPLLGADYGVIGEGEETAEELVAALEGGARVSEVAGIVYRDSDGECLRSPRRLPRRDLDAIPWPDFEGFGIDPILSATMTIDDYFFHLEDAPRSLPMISSRSCPFNCTFCFHPTGRHYRERGLDDFFTELEALIDRYKINMVAILDEIFAVKKPRILKFCERIRSYGIKWMVQLHVGVIDEEVIDAMKEAGCVYISYGIESVHDDILRSMEKKTTQAGIEQALEITRERRIGIQGNFIFGDAAETMETANHTMDWWSRNREYYIALSLLKVYPGAPVYQKAHRKGLILDKAEYMKEADVNISGIDDARFARLKRRLGTFRNTLFIPAKIQRFEKQPRKNAFGEDLYRVVWDCPSCGEVNDYRSITVTAPYNFQKILVTCRTCLSRSEVENRARQAWIDPEGEERYHQAAMLKQAGRLKEAMMAYMEILRRPYPPNVHNRPEAFIRAAFDAGNIFLQTQPGPEAAIHYFEEALLRRACDPAHHIVLAHALLAGGSDGAARLHCEQARMLAPPENAALAAGMEQLTAAVERESGAPPIYFS